MVLFLYFYYSCTCSCSCLSIYLSICKLETKLFCETSSVFELENMKKRSNSARLPQFLNLTTSKTKGFLFFEVDNIKNEAILRHFLQKWKVECRADGRVPMLFAIFPLHLSKVLRLPRKSEARSYEVLHLSRKIISANLKIWCSKMQPLRKCTIPCACHAKRHLNVQNCSVPLIFFPFWLGNVLRASMACTFSTSQLPKVVRAWCALYILTSKCASRHNGVHFFDISTSKSGPTLVCFVHFDFEMCFAPQRRALFRHLNFQKWSEHDVFCTLWLANVLRATKAWTFSTAQLLKVLRSWRVLCILTSKCASRHNPVQFFISHLASWPRARHFSEPTFRPSDIHIHIYIYIYIDHIFIVLYAWINPEPVIASKALLCYIRISRSCGLPPTDEPNPPIVQWHVSGALRTNCWLGLYPEVSSANNLQVFFHV